MEAATPLPVNPQPRVRTQGEWLVIDGLIVEDERAVRLAREREDLAEDPATIVLDAIEIGARVLDREHTQGDAEFVKAEFERSARALDAGFVERARLIAERLDAKVDEAFGPETGHVTKALERHFDDDSSAAVQNRVRAVLAEVATKMREDLARQFSSDSESNPLAGFQKASLAVIRQTADQQAQHLRAMAEKLEALKLELTELRAERDKQTEIAAVAAKGTAKGRTYEEAVFEAIDAIAIARGDDCEAVGDLRGVGGKKGDIVAAIDAGAGPARGRIVFEAKNTRLSKNAALAELDEAMAARNADFGVLVVPGEEKLPARSHPLRELNGDKLFVIYDPEDASRLALEVAYSLARARVLMSRAEGVGIDAAALRAEAERALGAMEDVRRIKSQLTNATTGIDQARTLLDAMADSVRAHLAQIDALLDAGAHASG